MLSRTRETEEDYEKIFQKLSGGQVNSQSKNTIIEAAKDTVYKPTWNKRRAAILYSCFNAIDQLLEHRKPLHGLGTDNLTNTIWYYIEIIQAIPDQCPLSHTEKSKSKKRVIKRLKNDWCEQMIVKIDPKYQLDLVLFGLTGCRPAELVNGIDAVLTKDKKLLVTIKTAKVKDGKIVIKDQTNQQNTKLVDYQAGQESRTLIFDAQQNNYFLKKLLEILKNTYDQRPSKPKVGKTFRINLNIANPKTLASKISRLGKKLFPGLNENISPYCFRHQFAVDLKSQGVSGDDISMMLGHGVDVTKEKYGFISRSKGSRSNIPVGVKTILRVNDPLTTNFVKKGRKRNRSKLSALEKNNNMRTNGGKYRR